MKSIVLSLLMFLPLLSSAQKLWSLEECMRYSVENSYATGRAERQLQTANQNFIGAIGRHLPSISASVGANGNFGRGVDPATNAYINTATFNNGYGINVGLPIFDAWSLVNNTRYQKINKLKARSQLQQSQDDIALQTMTLYIDVLYNAGLVDLTELKVANSRHDLERTERQSELGVKSMADVAQFAANLAIEELSLITRQNAYQTSVLRLKEIMNFPVEDTLMVEKNSIISHSNYGAASTIFDAAMAYLPAIDILKRTIAGEKLQLAIAKSAYYPSLSASAGISTSYYTTLTGSQNRSSADHFMSQIKNNLGEGVSVALSIPIFNGMSARTQIHKAKIAYEQAQSDYQEQMRALRIEIEQAVMDMDAAYLQVEGAQKAVKANELAHRAAQSKYEQGLLSVIELQTAANSLMLSQVELLSAQLRFGAKSKQVGYYAGEPLIK